MPIPHILRSSLRRLDQLRLLRVTMVPTMRTMRRTVSRRERTIRSLTTTSRPSSAKSSDTAFCETSAQTLPSPRANAHILSRAHNPSSAAQLFAVGSMRCDRWPQSHRHVLTGMQCSAVLGLSDHAGTRRRRRANGTTGTSCSTMRSCCTTSPCRSTAIWTRSTRLRARSRSTAPSFSSTCVHAHSRFGLWAQALLRCALCRVMCGRAGLPRRVLERQACGIACSCSCSPPGSAAALSLLVLVCFRPQLHDESDFISIEIRHSESSAILTSAHKDAQFVLCIRADTKDEHEIWLHAFEEQGCLVSRIVLSP